VLIIGPWNYPIHLTLTPLISAIAAGNCVVIKPSEITPASSAVLARLLPQYLDADAVAVVEGGPEATGELIAQVPDHCFFTGSPPVGRIVAAECGARLVPVTLELGGKCPAIVTRSANLRVAARRIAFGKITNSGQTCVAPDYVLVDREVRDAFVTELVETLARFSEGKPVPIVNARHAARLDGLLRTAAGRVALGGTIDTVNASADLTVIVDPDPDAPIVHEEIFGPLLPVLTVDSLDDALSHVRRGTRPLASYLFTEDGDEPDRAVAAISTGGFVVNHTMVHLGVPELPFGGVGTSGTGRYHGKWGFETFANPLAVLRKPSRPDPALFYPPRNPLVQRLLRALL